MSELTVTVIRLALLILLWVFVFSVVGVLRGDLYGTRVVSRPSRLPRSGRAAAKRAPARRASGGAREAAPARTGRAALRSLTVTEGPLRGTTVPLTDAGILLGRNPECTLVLDDDFASGRHARIYPEPQGWFVEDLGSTNGTFLGSHRLTGPTAVEAGTTLRIGQTVLELRK